MAMEFSSDLVEEILSWVPAKSLTLLRYTCKQWKTLIANPRFVKKHSSHMRCREKHVTIFNMVSKFDVVPLSSTISCVGMDFDEFSNPCMNLQVFKPIQSLVYNMLHCDGLLGFVMTFKLLVTNPLLKQGRWVTYSYGFDHKIDTFGLGYISNRSSSSCNDYKIVRFRCPPNSIVDASKVEVYEFKSDSWKAVVDKTFDGFFGLPSSSVCLRGTPYWLGYNKYDKKTFLIRSFDFSKERFEPFSLPPLSFEETDSLSLGIFRGDQLSLLHKSHATDKIQIWVMKQHWSRLMTVSIPQFPVLHKYSTYFFANNGKLVLTVCHLGTESVSIYIVGENQECQELKYDLCMDSIRSDCFYVPSLLPVPVFSRREEEEEEE